MVETERWIPCSERLPEDDEMVLVTCETKKGMRNVNRAYRSNGFWHGSGSMSGVTAWMPLPEPYSAEVEKPQTNADRIRSMTDEELAEVLFGSCIERMGVEECSHPVEDLKGIPACKSCVLDWLKAESEGEDAR